MDEECVGTSEGDRAAADLWAIMRDLSAVDGNA